MAHSEARERVLQAAEKLFVERGYAAVKITEIADAADIHHASIYHHLPRKSGKAALYVEVMTRNTQRHADGVRAAIAAADDTVRAQLQAIAGWFLSQPPIDMVRLSQSDLPALHDPDAANHLMDLMFFATLEPIVQVLAAAQARGEIGPHNTGNIAGCFLAAVEGLHSVPEQYIDNDLQESANELIDVLLKGMAVED